MANDTTPTRPNVILQPSASPIALPKGNPKIMATDVPVATMLTASEPCCGATRRDAATEAIDQKTACAAATTRRARMRIG